MILVRTNLEYASIVWSPYYQAYIDIIERVQNKFLRAAAFKMGIHFQNYHKADTLQRINLITLEQRRKFLDVCFMFKVLGNLFDCSGLLSRIGLNVPNRQLRNYNLFHLNFHKTNYGCNTTIDRTLRILNEMNRTMDVFNLSLEAFKRESIRYIKTL